MNLPLPANAIEFDRLYGDDGRCRQTLMSARWPNGFSCPKCQHNKGWHHVLRPLVECAACGHQTSALAGTMFHGAKLPLPKLFKLIYLLVAEKSGTNACALMRQVGVSYITAMLWARKFRTAIGRRGREKLKGTVEVDEAEVGGSVAMKERRPLGKNQALILVLVEDDNGACGRVRLEVVESRNRDGKELIALINKNVQEGSRVRTDGWRGYNRLDVQRFPHDVQQNPREGQSRAGYLQLAHRVTSLLKRFIGGVLHGSWTHAWLQFVLDEFVFRFNRRHCRARPLLFNRVIEFGIGHRAPTRKRFQEYTAVLKAA